MKKVCLLLFGSCLFLPAQEPSVTLDDLAESAQRWAAENLDDDALRILRDADQKRVRQFLADIQKQFQKEYILDLAQLKETAKAIIPLLEQYEETVPYAIWLKNQLVSMDVAERLGELAPPSPKPEPGRAPAPPATPEPQSVREIWIKKIAGQPWPPGAKRYVSTLKPVFIARKVPPELVWIAEVESSFDPRARSPAGAAGLFQLMPETARQYGLRTWPIDQRLKPEPSAGAAARHLKNLHAHYNDWRLALAAYNAGEGKVDRLLARQKIKTYDNIAKHLPAETQLYVPRIEATLLRREGLKLSQLRAPAG